MDQKFVPIVLAGNDDHDLSILSEYAEFWKLPYTLRSQIDQKPILFTSRPWREIDTQDSRPVIISPTRIEGAREIARYFGLDVTPKETHVRLPISPGVSVSLQTRLYQFSGPELEPVLKDGENILINKILGSAVHILSVDLVSEYQLMYGRMDENPNWRFRLLTRMPFSYRVIPSSIRNRFFKAKGSVTAFREELLGPVEFLRSLFLASLAIASQDPIPFIGFWRRGKSYALAVSHDVETQLGLEDGAVRLIEVEKELGIRSTWNLPTNRYPLSMMADCSSQRSQKSWTGCNVAESGLNFSREDLFEDSEPLFYNTRENSWKRSERRATNTIRQCRAGSLYRRLRSSLTESELSFPS